MSSSRCARGTPTSLPRSDYLLLPHGLSDVVIRVACLPKSRIKISHSLRAETRSAAVHTLAFCTCVHLLLFLRPPSATYCTVLFRLWGHTKPASPVVRVPTNINFLGSSLTECILILFMGIFSSIKKMNSGKRKSVSSLHPTEIDEQQWEC